MLPGSLPDLPMDTAKRGCFLGSAIWAYWPQFPLSCAGSSLSTSWHLNFLYLEFSSHFSGFSGKVSVHLHPSS